MISAEELFEKNGVELPELSDEYLEDDWADAKYSFEDGVHKLSYINEFGNECIITYDGETFLKGSYINDRFRCSYMSNGMYSIDY